MYLARKPSPNSGHDILPPTELTALGDTRQPIMVVSHKRSATHFMMNTLAACFDHISNS